jgi:hypothetical protein
MNTPDQSPRKRYKEEARLIKIANKFTITKLDNTSKRESLVRDAVSASQLFSNIRSGARRSNHDGFSEISQFSDTLFNVG